jgi:hypothetical protein
MMRRCPEEHRARGTSPVQRVTRFVTLGGPRSQLTISRVSGHPPISSRAIRIRADRVVQPLAGTIDSPGMCCRTSDAVGHRSSDSPTRRPPPRHAPGRESPARSTLRPRGRQPILEANDRSTQRVCHRRASPTVQAFLPRAHATRPVPSCLVEHPTLVPRQWGSATPRRSDLCGTGVVDQRSSSVHL